MSLFESVTGFATRVALRWRRQLLVALLALLYLVILLEPTSPLARTLFVAHLGLFIIWQPFVRADQRLSPAAMTLIPLMVAFVAIALDHWLLTFWIALLAGVVGGKVFLFEARWTKYFFLLALFWLVATLLLLALPAALPTGISAGNAVFEIGHWVMPAVLVLMSLLPERRETGGQPEVIDFVYSVIVVLLLAVLVLGSLALMLLLGHDYVGALLETLLSIGLALLILGWVWNPHLGMAGVGTVFSRYLMSVGMPVEQWLHALADLAQRQNDPDDFLAGACRDMVRRLPWVTGVEWRTDGASRTFGVVEGRCSEFTFDALVLRIFTRYPLSPSLAWHFNLLAQLIAEFRADKLRARQLKRLSYIEAIHETGARLTHDVKNLLQSLRALCTVTEGDGGAASPEFVALLRRQLPAITARLGQTLDKLQAPRLENTESMPAVRWWEELRSRFAVSGIEFAVKDGVPDTATVPAALLNHATENLIANALDKRAGSPGLQIRVTLRVDSDNVSIDVDDDGAAIPLALAENLLRGPVPSETGFGIGLYQSARLLEQGGYAIQLIENEPGKVCFRVAPAVS